jgi:aspartyl-tRNA(Asn)/glutamyl-tRNA(Gln) amidotransferase subunit C
MQSLSHDEVRAIADLARLALTEEDVAKYATQLSQILSYFQKLQEVDTSQMPPMASVLPVNNVLRVDVAAQALTPAQATLNAPSAEDDQFKVSAVLDE